MRGSPKTTEAPAEDAKMAQCCAAPPESSSKPANRTHGDGLRGARWW